VRVGGFNRANGDRFSEKTVSIHNVALRNPLKLNGSLLFVTVFGGARPEGFPVTPLKTPVSFRFCKSFNTLWLKDPQGHR
jgi:hypothetical protein